MVDYMKELHDLRERLFRLEEEVKNIEINMNKMFSHIERDRKDMWTYINHLTAKITQLEEEGKNERCFRQDHRKSEG